MKSIFWILAPICVALFVIIFMVHTIVLKGMWNYLIVDEEPKSADVIIVLSGDVGRLEYAVKLYHQGYANKLLLTGSTDARVMSAQAQKLGVPQDNIIVDDKSYTTFLNAEHSTQIMRTQGLNSALVVTSPYHTKRSRMIFDEFSSRLDVIMCSVPYDSSMSNYWWKDNNTRKKVIKEYLKFAWHYVFERPRVVGYSRDIGSIER